MKTIYKGIAGIGFILMAVIVFAIVVSFTLDFAEQIWHDNLIARYGAVIFSDAGALIWIGVFVYQAKTKMQRLTAFSMFLFDLVIVALMIAVNTLVASESYPEIRQLATIALAVSAFVNLAAVYWFHLHGEDTNKEIEFGDITADVETEAMAYLKMRKADLSKELAHILGERLLDDALNNFKITRGQIGLTDDTRHRAIETEWKDPKPEPPTPIAPLPAPKIRQPRKFRPIKLRGVAIKNGHPADPTQAP